ncbi:MULTISPECIES: MFS transporter [Paraburkholderia]|jgi:MFS transporter, MHS family, proline/betaine transporter|uniref:MFS transporter, MHS family, proline/betaine transporter n=1 Tax=Paraburkholderia aspalathi TaxID=1324617 RepID=A0A1I7EJR6_9BURK|nr:MULTISPECIES: MFS transporter [Paraburkholderia]MCP2084181.1 MHS family proline/betaine transporter-like MFS transporter [Paraburkholderia sediminicola]MBK3838854.1 MFS transporter [Paraburkholderia aspalathi]MCX4138885.1 MFS transporter [Paraburkholderia aspalathi]MCX4154517.1 MFS transporter [Paraburkholderia aspalathi]MDN7163932.1 MFS transporter [Paraburkholderia sp. SECH2]
MSTQPLTSSGTIAVSQTRIVVAAVVGNLLEFFDFTVYSFFALTIAKLFFPSQDPVVSTLLALSAFAIGFVARPVGGFVLGHYADKRGRRAALTLTIFLMAVGSAAIGLAPTYETIGIAAPALIVVARLVQGFAQGGEFGAATATLLETGSAKGRGFRASWQLASQGAAALLGSGMAALLTYHLTGPQLLDWGWRVPFLAGTLIMPVGVYLRRHIVDDEPVKTEHSRFEPALVRKWFLTVFAIMGMTVATYVLMYYIPTYSIQYLKMPPKLSMLVSIGAACVSLLMCPIWGALSDRMGRRKPLTVLGRVVLIALLYPAFWLMNQFPTLPVVTGLIVLLMFFYTMGSAPAYALMPENFPKHVRAGYLASAYAVAVSVFGGTAQLVVAWLIKVTGNTMAPAWYMIACVIISLCAVTMLEETGGRDLA